MTVVRHTGEARQSEHFETLADAQESLEAKRSTRRVDGSGPGRGLHRGLHRVGFSNIRS